MSDCRDTSASTDEGEIARLVSTAEEVGAPDGYSGKRHWPRFRAGLRLDVTLDPTHASGSEEVIMHNASGGGLAFWSRRKWREREAVYVREFRTDGGSAEWLAARVCHCTAGIRGFLVGVQYYHPAPSDDADGSVVEESVAATAASPEPSAPASDAPPLGRRRWFKRRPKD